MINKITKLISGQDLGVEIANNDESIKIINKNGSFNVLKKHSRFHLYHELIQMPTWKFIIFIFISYVMINLFFAGIYYAIGMEELGLPETGSAFENYIKAYYFSSQTLTTVGYGAISPVGTYANLVASLEAFIGLVGFALITGLVWGIFSKPKSHIIFSDNILIAPYKKHKGLMFRIANASRSQVTNGEMDVITSFLDKKTGKRKSTRLKLEVSEIVYLAMNWTLVHKIDDSSPLFNFSREDYFDKNVEFIVQFKGYDETYSGNIQTRHAYTENDIIFDAKFTIPYHPEKGKMYFDLEKIHEYELMS